MATITWRKDGTYAIEGLTGPPFLVLSMAALQQLLDAMIDAGMIEQDGVKVVRTRKG